MSFALAYVQFLLYLCAQIRTNSMEYEIISGRQEKVLRYLEDHHIPFTTYNHPEGKTIEEAKRWWHDDGSVHCKNIFMRNHKGDQHYLICFPCDEDLAIHDIEHWLKEILVSQGKKAPGKLQPLMKGEIIDSKLFAADASYSDLNVWTSSLE